MRACDTKYRISFFDHDHFRPNCHECFKALTSLTSSSSLVFSPQGKALNHFLSSKILGIICANGEFGWACAGFIFRFALMRSFPKMHQPIQKGKL